MRHRTKSILWAALCIFAFLLPVLEAPAGAQPAHTTVAAAADARLDVPPPRPLDHMATAVGGSLGDAEAFTMAQAGVQLVRIGANWSQVEPRDGGGLHWQGLDNTLLALAHWRIGVVLTLGANPAWAASVLDGPVDRAPIARYFDFVQATAARYSQAPYTVRAWEVYNEPDSQGNWGHRATDYVAMLQQDYRILKRAAPDLPVLLGGLGYDDFESQGGPFVRSFLPDVLAAGGAASFDVVSFHHYPNDTGNWPTIGSALQSVQATLAGAGVSKAIMWSETGASTDAPWGTLMSQAVIVPKVFAAGLGLGAGTVAWYPFQDYNGYYFGSHGLERIDGSQKPSFASYQIASSYLAGSFTLRPQDSSELGNNPAAEAYNFLRGNGGAVSVGWATGSTGSESWPAAHVQGVSDIFGHPSGYTVSGDQAVVPLSDSPVYIQLDRICRFGDVAWGYWARPFVESLCWQGVVSGYADGSFRPGNNATRGQIAKMVVLGMGWPIDTSRGQVFGDVPASNAFYPYISTAYAHSIVSGYADGSFRPGANVTRGQLSKMLTLAKGWSLQTLDAGTGNNQGDGRRGGGHPTPTPTPGPPPPRQDFVDVPPTHPFYAYIEAVFLHGVVSGYADHTFRPYNNATRAQLTKMIIGVQNQP